MAVIVNDIVKAAINELSQVPGIATQVYASPRLQQFVQNAILLEIEEMWWPQLMFYQSVPIDPDSGLLAADLVGPISAVDEYGDVAAVYHGGTNQKVPELPPSVNPFSMTGAGSVRYISADSSTAHRPFRVWPIGATGNVDVWARQRLQTPATGTDKVYIDQTLILYDACWMYAVDDGTVPAQVNKYQVLAANRRKKMLARYSQHPTPLDPRYNWQEMLDQGDDSFFVLDQDPLA